jgi:hypothetical protein
MDVHEVGRKSGAVLVIGNCQAAAVAASMRCLYPELQLNVIAGPSSRRPAPAAWSDYRHVFAQSQVADAIDESARRRWSSDPRITWFPSIVFPAYHPDLVYVTADGALIDSAVGQVHSCLVFYGFMNGLGVDAIARLFNDEVFRELGFYDLWEPSRQAVVGSQDGAALGLDALFHDWARRGCFMHTFNHPKLFVLADLARVLLTRAGFSTRPVRPEDVRRDPFLDSVVWPVYPEVAARLGIEGSYFFKASDERAPVGTLPRILDLSEMIAGSVRIYQEYAPATLACTRRSDRYDALIRRLKGTRKRVGTHHQGPARGGAQVNANPYDGLPAHQFWRSAVAQCPPSQIDPVIDVPFSITRQCRVATAGSCFAQHLSRALARDGYNYYVAEQPDEHTSSLESAQRNFGVFSTRSGNVYTARQLVQLIRRAYGEFEPEEGVWQRNDGKYVDALRPRIEPDGFADVESLEASRATHLAAVRRMFEELDVFVFTLGLTEGWQSRIDGTVFPLAPGVAGGELDVRRHRFVNFSVTEVTGDLRSFVPRLRAVNSKARIIFTVSPVPLTATYERQHVLVSTTYSKAVLRVAAHEVSSAFRDVAYFPSYEIITGARPDQAYFESNRRSVRPEGVEHVMRVFSRHYYQTSEPVVVTEQGDGSRAGDWVAPEIQQVEQIICDDEVLDRAALD